MWQALGHFFGLDNGGGANYLFWSGVGSDFTEVALIGAAYTVWRRHNCGVRGCWRIGRRVVPGTDHVACNRHHPNPPPTHAQMLDEHREAMGKD